jgi:putative Mg2+ transporter-C (MgtC) family protein
MIQLQMLAYIALAMLLGGLVGLEREFADKPAGLRTHMLVAGAAALLVSLGDAVVAHFDVSNQLVRTDPVRIIEAVVTGVTFLGAGTIIRQKQEIEGLTTAASLFFVTGLGVAVGLNHFTLAIGATILIIVILAGIKPLEKWLETRRQNRREANTSPSNNHEKDSSSGE